MSEKISFGDLPRQLRKVLNWRSLLVFLVVAPCGCAVVILTGGELLRLSMRNDLYIFTVNLLSWIPPLIAIQITYLIRKYQVRKHEDRLLDEISQSDVIGFLNSPIVVVVVGAITVGLLEAYLFWFIGIAFDFNSISAFWAWPGITWARWTPLLFTIAGTYWLLRESEKDRAQYTGLEFTKSNKVGSQPTSKVSESQVAPDTGGNAACFVIALDVERVTYPRLEEVEEYNDSIEVHRDAIATICADLIEEIASRLDGYRDCLVGLREAGREDEGEVLLPYKEPILDGTFDNSLGGGMILYLRFEGLHDSDVINEEFLSMSAWGFFAYWVDENDQVRSQSYDFGEFDTGYYAALEWGNDESDYLDAVASQPVIGLRKAVDLPASVQVLPLSATVSESTSPSSADSFIEESVVSDSPRATTPDAKTDTGGNAACFVIALDVERVTYPRLEEVEEYNDSIEVHRDAIATICADLIEEIASRLDGYRDCLVGLREAGREDEGEVLLPYKEPILDGTFDNSLGGGMILYLRFEGLHDSDVINEEFLSMSAWGFFAYWVDENDQVRSQSYDFGEFDTGYYAALEWGNDESDYLDAVASQPVIGLRKAAGS